MNNKIREILDLAKQLDEALNCKLADSLTSNMIKIAKSALVSGPMPSFKLPTFNVTPKVTQPITPLPPLNFGTSRTTSNDDIVKFNKNVEVKKLPENEDLPVRRNKKAEEIVKKGLKIWRMVKKPNNIYSDYVDNSKDEVLKLLNEKIKSIPESDIKAYLLNLYDTSFFTESKKNKTQIILGWAYKMHIINFIPPKTNISYSRSAIKPGQNEKVKKVDVKTKTEGRLLPSTPTLPSTSLPKVSPTEKEETKKETTVRPVQIPEERTSPITTAPLETTFFPTEVDENLLTPEIMTPIMSPKRQTTLEETSYGPMDWNQFLNFLNPNSPLGQAPTNSFEQNVTPSRSEEPTRLNQPTTPATDNKPPKQKEPLSSTPLVFDLKLPPSKSGPAGGISYLEKFPR